MVVAYTNRNMVGFMMIYNLTILTGWVFEVSMGSQLQELSQFKVLPMAIFSMLKILPLHLSWPMFFMVIVDRSSGKLNALINSVSDSIPM